MEHGGEIKAPPVLPLPVLDLERILLFQTGTSRNQSIREFRFPEL